MATKAHTSKGIVLGLSCAAQFMVVLDIAIVNVALPSIQQDLGIEQSTLQWIVIAYGLMLGGFLLLGGRMADLLGRRRMLLTGLRILTATTPMYIKSASSPARPRTPTARTIQTRVNAAASTTPTADRYAVFVGLHRFLRG